METLNLLELGAPVPVRGPVVITSIFSSEKGFVLLFRLSPSIFAAIVFPPMYSSRSSSDQGYSVVSRVDKSIFNTLPM